MLQICVGIQSGWNPEKQEFGFGRNEGIVDFAELFEGGAEVLKQIIQEETLSRLEYEFRAQGWIPIGPPKVRWREIAEPADQPKQG